MASDATEHSQFRLSGDDKEYKPMPLLLLVLIFSSATSGVPGFIVEVDVDRLPSEFFSGPKWVSLNSERSQH